MGSSSSKFRKHLQNGDEYAALQLYNNNSDLRKGLDPNMSYGDTYNHDTPLHFAARHGMKSLLRIFLNEHGGNPNKKNTHNETSLHCVCQATQGGGRTNLVVQQRRAECLSMVLAWRGATLRDGEVEKVDLGAKENLQLTALHHAASSGLRRCVELLVCAGAPLFSEDATKRTPCDSAEAAGHADIARYLESKMVFSNEDDDVGEVDLEGLLDQMETETGYSGLRAQDLQEAKDQLLVETSDMLRVPLFTAEALLRNHEWSREMLLESWMDDPVACCEKCGVVPPTTVLSDQSGASTSRASPPMVPMATPAPGNSHLLIEQHLDDDLFVTPVTPSASTAATSQHNDGGGSEDNFCDICANVIAASEERVPMACGDAFCRQCWNTYLCGKIAEGDAHNITCPGFGCSMLVPVELIETLVSRDMARRYLQFDIKAFVESNPAIKWCPYPGCGRAVKLPDAATGTDHPLSPRGGGGGLGAAAAAQDFSHAVDCGSGHMFCWECSGEAHEPVSCPNWKCWHEKIAEIKPETLSQTEGETELAANCLWLVTNSKPCPNCKSPIQKNEGCNHMKCSKCKHDFCWVCLEPWKKHSSATGGYFRCNRYEVLKKVEDTTNMLKAEAEARNKKMQELNRFVHYYSRFKNHEHSFQLEEPLSSTAKEKMVILARAITDPDSANLETKFVEDAVIQLLKARRVLKCSYAYGYYLEDTGYKKPIFEFMQTELEECTETLSEMIARPYLRTPRSKIIHTAHLVQRKRQEFVTAISKGLVPPDSSPGTRKRKKYNVELDDDLKKALMASIQDMDPSNPWVKDPTGKHTNVALLLDWPEEDDDDDDYPSFRRPSLPPSTTTPQTLPQSSPRPSHQEGLVGEIDEDPSSLDQQEEETVASRLADCVREGCTRPRAQNPRTGEVHDHCSVRCMMMDRESKAAVEDDTNVESEELFTDYQIDLLRALEMSRLQFLREMGQLRPGSVSSHDRSPPPRSPRSPHPAPPPPPTSIAMLPSPPPPPLSDRRAVRRSPSPAPPTRALTPRPEPGLETGLHRLVLADPPKGRPRVRSEPSAVTTGALTTGAVTTRRSTGGGSSTGEFDVELQRALEMSRRSLNAEERDLRMAIELSLADARHPPPAASGNQQHDDHQLLQYPPQYSTIVTRVPNKSVEDLPSASLAEATSRPAAGAMTTNPFGLIKDLCVSNLLPTDADKTKDFQDKDFSRVFIKYASPGDMDADVFEPRPPQSPYSPRPAAPGNHHRDPADPWQLRQDHHDDDELDVTSFPPPPPPPPPQEEGESMLPPPPPAAMMLAKEEDAESSVTGQHQQQQQQGGTIVSDDDLLHVDSQMLESLIQGAQDFPASGGSRQQQPVAGETTVLLDGRESGDDDDSDKDAVFV